MHEVHSCKATACYATMHGTTRAACLGTCRLPSERSAAPSIFLHMWLQEHACSLQLPLPGWTSPSLTMRTTQSQSFGTAEMRPRLGRKHRLINLYSACRERRRLSERPHSSCAAQLESAGKFCPHLHRNLGRQDQVVPFQTSIRTRSPVRLPFVDSRTLRRSHLHQWHLFGI